MSAYENVNGVSLKHIKAGPDSGWYAKRPWGWVFLATSRYAAHKIARLGFDPSMRIDDPRQPLGNAVASKQRSSAPDAQ